MKKILLKILLIIFSSSITFFDVSAQIIEKYVVNDSIENIISIIDRKYSNDSIEVFISKNKFIEGATLHLWSENIIIPFDCYVIFIDFAPGQNWGHKCEYLFVSGNNQKIMSIENITPPKDLVDLFYIYKKGIYNVGNIIRPTQPKKPLSIQRIRRNVLSNQKFAVIISGGHDAYNNYVRYWNDCSAIYQTLINNGYDKANIYVVMSDGRDPADDLRVGDSCISSPLDLDGDSIDDIEYAANIDNIRLILDSIKDRITINDDLFIFVTDHGSRTSDGHSLINLWDSDVLMDTTFAQMITPISQTARTINILMEPCYSGGFIDDFRDIENLVITTACDANETSWAMKDMLYDAFVYSWLTAVNGRGPKSLYPYFYPTENVENMDYNTDGYISMEEAYENGCFINEAKDFEHPQIASYPYCLAGSLTISNLLNLCGGNLLVDSSDLYIKDCYLDLGEEPNVITDEFWTSEDIWFEEAGERVETLMSGQTYDVCVKIKNRGNDASNENSVLYLHWSKAIIGGDWPWGWDSNYLYDCDGSLVRRGELFGEITLPVIESGENYIVRVPWTTPESEEYSPCIEFEGDNLLELWHYCILARIVENPDFSYDSELTLRELVLNHNNVASRNVTIMDLQIKDSLETSLVGIVGLTNPRAWEDSGPYRLNCSILGDGNWNQYASVSLTFSSNFYNSQPNIEGVNCDEYSPGSFSLNSNAYFDGIYFSGNDDELHLIKLDINYLYFFENETFPDIIVSLELIDNSGNIIGGETFKYKQLQPELENEGDMNERLYNIPSILKYSIHTLDVYDIQGHHLFTISSKDYLSLYNKLPQGLYIINVRGEDLDYKYKIFK